MNEIIFDAKLIKQDNKDIIQLSAKNKIKEVKTYFSVPLSAAELVIDLTFTLNSLVSQLNIKNFDINEIIIE